MSNDTDGFSSRVAKVIAADWNRIARQFVGPTCVVSDAVNREGQVSDVALVRGTGSALLDDAVLALLNKARLPAFPMDMTQQTITVTVQINYALQR